MKKIILASQSPYRARLLRRLTPDFRQVSAPVDESALKSELLKRAISPVSLAVELARAKALFIPRAAHEVVIGGDQLLHLDGEILGKAGSSDRAVEQLMSLSGRCHELITAVCLVEEDGSLQEWQNIARMTLRPLAESEAREAVEADQAWDCAGSYKIEGRGIGLMESVECDDWTAIEGLPLIELGRRLRGLLG